MNEGIEGRDRAGRPDWHPPARSTPPPRVRNWRPMVAAVLVFSGSFATAYGCWRGYAAARGVVAPLVVEGDATRQLVEATRPVHARAKVRAALRALGLSLFWLAIAMYGLYLVTVGVGVAG
jgi:hypothetical protein